MITLRKSEERGHIDHGWLNTYHTFSFADYYDPKHTHFRNLRVINEDYVAGGEGFGTHPHRDMEILTYIVSGALEHKDSMGNGSVIRPGDIQYMSAGTGVLHSEFNPSDEPVHLLQIWIMPQEKGLPPRYDQKHFTREEKKGRLRLIASPDGAEGSARIQQDARLFASILEAGQSASLELAPKRHAWLQLISGTVDLNGQTVKAGDGAGVSEEPKIALRAKESAEFLLFDLN